MKRFDDHFSAVAARYAAFRPSYPPSLFTYLATLAPRRALAWDAATGSGQAAVALADHFDRVVACDASAEQIAHAVRHRRVAYLVARAELPALAPRRCDLVTVAQGLHWFDIPAFFAEVGRVLRPRGVLAAWTYSGPRLDDPRLDAVFRRFARETVGGYWPPERAMPDTGYATIAFPFTRLEPPPFTLEMTPTLAELGGYLRTWSATRRYVEAKGDDPVAPLEDELRTWWHDGSPRRLTWPLHLWVCRVD